MKKLYQGMVLKSGDQKYDIRTAYEPMQNIFPTPDYRLLLKWAITCRLFPVIAPDCELHNFTPNASWT